MAVSRFIGHCDLGIGVFHPSSMKRAERYEILETIQEGMAAVTYKANDRVLDRPVLLKVLHPRLASDSDLV